MALFLDMDTDMTLTDQQRDYLRDSNTATLPFYDMVRGFIRQFNLTPEQAGMLLAQWVRESV